MWGIGILMLAIFGIFLISLFGNITVTNQQDYTAMKNTVETAMYDAVDLARFRTGFCICTNKNMDSEFYYSFNSSDEYEMADLVNGECIPNPGSIMVNCSPVEGEYAINKKIFAESLVRRFAESVKGNSDYQIVVEDVVEYPPKVSISVNSTNSYEIGGGDYNIYNHMDAILEMDSQNVKKVCENPIYYDTETGDYHDIYGNYCGHYKECEEPLNCTVSYVRSSFKGNVAVETCYDKSRPTVVCKQKITRQPPQPTPVGCGVCDDCKWDGDLCISTCNKHTVCDRLEYPSSNVSSSGSSSSSGGESKPIYHTCFLAGTPVITKNGFKSIDKMLVGDFVLTYNEEKEINEYKRVKNVYIIKDVNEKLYTVKTNDTEFSLTGHHRVYTFRDGKYQYISAENLNVGDVVRYSNGEYHEITSISHKPINDTVYNLEVEGNHNFFVNENGILVHNMSGIYQLLLDHTPTSLLK